MCAGPRRPSLSGGGFKVAERASHRVRLPFPISLNNAFSQTRTGRRFKSARYARWQSQASVLIRAARIPPLVGPVTIAITVTPPDLRRRDIDNLIKPILDALVNAAVLRNDDARSVRAVWAGWSGDVDRERSCADVTIEEAGS